MVRAYGMRRSEHPGSRQMVSPNAGTRLPSSSGVRGSVLEGKVRRFQRVLLSGRGSDRLHRHSATFASASCWERMA